MKQPLYQAMAQTFAAYKGCIDMGNSDYETIHRDKLDMMAREYLPSGSGVDNGTTIDVDRCTLDSMVLRFGWHYMNEDGYYCGWINFVVGITASLRWGFDVQIATTDTDKDEQVDGLLDYLHDLYQNALAEEGESW